LNGKAIKYELMEKYIPESDVVISATSAPHFVLTKDIVLRLMENREKELLFIDIGTRGT